MIILVNLKVMPFNIKSSDLPRHIISANMDVSEASNRTFAPKPVKAKRDLNLNPIPFEKLGKVPFNIYTPKIINRAQIEALKTENGFDGRSSLNLDFGKELDEMNSKNEILSILRNESTFCESTGIEDLFTFNTNDSFGDEGFLFIEEPRKSSPPVRTKNPIFKTLLGECPFN